MATDILTVIEQDGDLVVDSRLIAERLGDALGGAKCDLFARRQRENWTCWGNELGEVV
jgi:N6-adenosine-specific RNA methylase IME4